uniref:Uncharacterized protein n=1 Tax=Myoviridae sp. ctGBP5 TaxID=2825071 RepID=A0A8S5PC94_9CAUD|nr:MAG TPA: hypothetical protein [Myoviridae sp. ctGBP5]
MAQNQIQNTHSLTLTNASDFLFAASRGAL